MCQSQQVLNPEQEQYWHIDEKIKENHYSTEAVTSKVIIILSMA